ncbi:MAG: threonine/serine dehydratase [Nitratireductor sp.]|nr:threonine/serine dehydratase [Nitratireductor sp.]MCB1455794.1 threonine/serine dehydratase [Nitratireductor sp.]
MSDIHVPDLDEITRAYSFTRKATIETPLLEAEQLARLSGAARVFVKPESLQRTGSFKFRGACWRVNQLTAAEKERGVVAYSSGNFAQGLAAACHLAAVPCTIVMPVDAPEAKRKGAESFGARIVLSHHGDKPREEVASALAREIARNDGLVLLHPFDDSSIVAGQAGAGLEALEQFDRLALPYPDTVFCCVGGGGLVGGVSLAFHYRSSPTRVIAVEPEGYDGMGRSLDASTITRATSSNPTICDALQATAPGTAPFAAVTKAGIGHVSVSDDAVRRAMRIAFETLKLVLEPSGAIAIAALLESQGRCEGRTVLCYATGGNITFENFSGLLAA